MAQDTYSRCLGCGASMREAAIADTIRLPGGLAHADCVEQAPTPNCTRCGEPIREAWRVDTFGGHLHARCVGIPARHVGPTVTTPPTAADEQQVIQEFLALPAGALTGAVVVDGDEDEDAWPLLRAMAQGKSAIEMGTSGTRIRLSADRPEYPRTIVIQ